MIDRDLIFRKTRTRRIKTTGSLTAKAHDILHKLKKITGQPIVVLIEQSVDTYHKMIIKELEPKKDSTEEIREPSEDAFDMINPLDYEEKVDVKDDKDSDDDYPDFP